MAKSSFQDIILTLQEFWAQHDCLIAQPYYTQVGAGTMNPATFLRVLGPEPWNVAYVEPSVRPDDGRYGENPNRFQLHTQYQVILKPDPGNPQELYLESLKALGIDPKRHDIRFVEDNWEQPAISAWGLGWEVWLDGQEITQFTYFQQMGGLALDPVSVEITYGLERILIALNNAKAIWDEPWGAGVSYGEIRRREEFEHSKYYFETADVGRVREMFELFLAEADACLARKLVLPAHDYVLKCSHAFNILDTRGAISVAERQAFFRRMRELARGVAEAFVAERKDLGFPLVKEAHDKPAMQAPLPAAVTETADFVLEVGVEEMPADDVTSGITALQTTFERDVLHAHKLEHASLQAYSTPRRLALKIRGLAPQEPTAEAVLKGPPESAAFDADGRPTQALLGWAKKNQLDIAESDMRPESLVREVAGGRYVAWRKKGAGASTSSLLSAALPDILGKVRFEKSMRWNDSGVSFSRPVRWIVAVYGDRIIPFEFAGVASGSTSRGLRPDDSPPIEIRSAAQYEDEMERAGILLDSGSRKESVRTQVGRAASQAGGEALMDEALLAEVVNLVEKPTALLGNFNPDFLRLPKDVLITVMKKHQRYFPIEREGKLLPNFVAIRNGDGQHLDIVQQGNEHVLGARFADADFFVREDLKQPLKAYRPELAGLMFHAKLGSMLEKSRRMEKLASALSTMMGVPKEEAATALRATTLSKADLVTQMVTEMTSLQGVIGREYALRSGEEPAVATAIGEQYEPIPSSNAGLIVALADRLDSLVGLFAIGLAPTSAKDPFGLRRAALGVVEPLIHHDVHLDLAKAVERAGKLQPVKPSAKRISEILEFLAVRLAVLLKEAGYRYDVVEAVIAEQSTDPAGAKSAVEQLQSLTAREDWKIILPAFARCVRITRDQKNQLVLKPKALKEKEEKALYRELHKAQAALRRAGRPDPDAFVHAFAPMIPSIDTFFDKVLVMAKTRAVRENRLALLQGVAGLATGVADFSKLEGF